MLQIGVMYGGKLLAEDNPTALMKAYNALLLEDVVLSLCRNDFGANNNYPPDDCDDCHINSNVRNGSKYINFKQSFYK